MGPYELLSLFFQFLDSFAFLVLATVGLAIIFGMMGVINLAHGEFILVGAYATTLSFHSLADLGVPLALPIAMVVGVLVTMVFGLVLEVTVMRRLYGRLLDSMVATWAISLIMIQLLRIQFGNSIDNIAIPGGNVSFGPYTNPYYELFLVGAAIAVLIGLYWLFTRTDFGMRARATIQDKETARSMGVDTDRMYMTTFVIGSGLAGLTGALYAPMQSMSPEAGTGFLVEAFVTVVVGGTSVIVGTLLASGLLGLPKAGFEYAFNSQLIGQVAMLVVAIVAIRLMPSGITGLVESWRQSRRESND
ncbi:urea ABC transporter, permease protein UrtB [Halobacteria archaeon AArc-m2/3/4]|uniref:Urea ABC transporter, permease protein UrtB n=1 Tax=Natronoglomus mannanivorans TaxID=2979990 RepID=A0ABT2QF10_9EURY|nr:urea ABC transporter, permease protein UrtB [Halobacteria archaeon AArc-m2/3/4]